MKKTKLLLTLLLGIGISSIGSAQTLAWARLSGSLESTAITSDQSGNSYALTNDKLEKRTSSGTLSWSNSIISNTEVGFTDAAADRVGNTYLCGIYISEKLASDPAYTLTIGTTTLTLPSSLSVTAYNDYNMILAKVNSAGNLVWIKNFNSVSDMSDIRSVATDANNNVYITGVATHETTFDNGYNVPSTYSRFIAKLNSSGSCVYAKVVMTSSSLNSFMLGAVTGKELAVNDAGELALTGVFSINVHFDPYGTDLSMGGGTNDIFIARYNSSGVFQWAKRIGGTAAVEINSCIQIDNSGNTYCGGLFSGTINFNPYGSAVNKTPVGGRDMFIHSLNSAGTFRWVSTIGGTGDEGLFAIALTDFDLHFTGGFSGTVDFNPGTGVNNLTATGGTDVFTASLNLLSGVYTYCYKNGSTGNDLAKDICGIPVTGNTAIFETGTFENTVDFDPAGGTVNLTSTASSKVFVTKTIIGTTSGRLANAASPADAAMVNSVYPNPFAGNIHISLANAEQTYTVTVYAIDGRMVYSSQINGAKETDLDLSGLNSGIYLMNIESEGKTEQHKIIKQ